MARILDAQRLAEAKHLTPAANGSSSDVDDVGTEPITDAVSYIEVGGQTNGLQASADVLASPVGEPRPERGASGPGFSQQVPTPPIYTETGPLFVSLRTWPDAAALPFPELICFHQPDHPASEQYRDLLASILTEGLGTAPQTLYFTGMAPGSGTTTVLLNLAVCACEEGRRRVAVVDLNTARPAIAKRLGVSSGPWLDEVIAGRRGLESTLLSTRARGLFVLSPDVQGERTISPSAEEIRWMLSWLDRRFDVVFIDGPVWEDNQSLPSTDAVFLVLPAEGPSALRVGRIAQEIARRGGRFRGFLQTRVQIA
jgi:hypothetical protein